MMQCPTSLKPKGEGKTETKSIKEMDRGSLQSMAHTNVWDLPPLKIIQLCVHVGLDQMARSESSRRPVCSQELENLLF